MNLPVKRLDTNNDSNMASNGKLLKNSESSLILQLKEGLSDWILMSPTSKAAFYWLIVIVGSFIHDFVPLPHSYFSNKKNSLNLYFVKFCWGWTFAVLFAFITSTSFIYSSCNLSAMLRHLCRLIVGTFGWYFWVNIFNYIEEVTGVCEGEESLTTKSNCHHEGYHWVGFDTSGHAFLLIYSALVISEEIHVKQWWDPHGRLNLFLRPLIDLIFFSSSLLLLLWEFMLVITSVYFHPVQEKAVGALVALFTWQITYQVWYKNELSPGLPWQPTKFL